MEHIDISKYKTRQLQNPGRHKNLGTVFYAILSKDIRFGSAGFSDQRKAYFFSELSTLLDSDIDLKNSLDLVVLDGLKNSYSSVCNEIKAGVISGNTLAQAVNVSGQFSAYDFYSIQIGEETGRLGEVLGDLAKYYSSKVEQKRKIFGALTYPIIVLSTSAGAVFFMLRFVVPMFSEVFKRFGSKLPWMTEVVINFSHFAGRYFLPFLFVLGILLLLMYRYKNNLIFRKLASDMILKIPVVGDIVRKIYLSRFCNTMRLLISTKIPLLSAIAMCEQTIEFYPLEVSLKHIQSGIVAGRSLHECLKDYAIYPPKLIQLVKVGEEINRLDHFFDKLSKQYVDEIGYQTNALSKLIEPLIIIFLGTVVGFILIAMYLPCFK